MGVILMNVILNRIANIHLFPTSFLSYINHEELSSCIEKIKKDFENNKVEIIQEINIADLDQLEIQTFLQTLPFGNERTLVIWVFESFGIQLPFNLFCKYFDELWFPSSDDIWICDTQHLYRVEISHEEKITLACRKTK
jgi:hypothetical protein